MHQTLNPNNKLATNPLQIEDSIYGTPDNNNLNVSQIQQTTGQNFNRSFVETATDVDMTMENDMSSSVGGGEHHHQIVKIHESH